MDEEKPVLHLRTQEGQPYGSERRFGLKIYLLGIIGRVTEKFGILQLNGD